MDQQLGDTLRAILSDPDSMKSILKIARNLGAQNADASSENAPPHENGSADSEEGASAKTEESAILPDASDVPHNTESTAETVLPERKEPSAGRDDGADNRVKLLMALRPFLDPARQKKADSLIKALGAAKVLYQLGENDLFKGFGF